MSFASRPHYKKFAPLAPANAGWNTADRNVAIALSNSNKTANGTATGWAAVRGVSGQSTGKRYFELVTGSSFDFNNNNKYNFGVASGDAPLNVNLYNGGGAGHRAAADFSGWYGSDGVTTSNTTGLQNFGSGVQVVCVTVDFSIREMQIYYNGSRDHNTPITWGAGAALMYPICAFNMALTAASGLTLRTLASEFQYLSSMPAGFVAWDS